MVPKCSCWLTTSIDVPLIKVEAVVGVLRRVLEFLVLEMLSCKYEYAK